MVDISHYYNCRLWRLLSTNYFWKTYHIYSCNMGNIHSIYNGCSSIKYVKEREEIKISKYSNKEIRY